MFKRLFVPAVIIVLAIGVLTPSVSSAATTQAASQYLQTLGDEALSIISNKKFGKSEKQARLDKMFSDNVDIPWVGRFVMGRYWREATDQQKATYLKEYENFIIKHYTSRFVEYTSGSFTITNSQDDGDNEFTVSMKLQGSEKNSEPILIDYRVRADEKNKFKIFDVIVEGVSMITTQRAEFSSVISRHDVDFLISQLANHSLPSENKN